MDRHSPLRLHVPEPTGRPGQATDFSYLHLSPAGAIRRPPLETSARDTADLAYTLIRVLDDEGKAVGPWDPKLSADQLKRGLRGGPAFDAAPLCREPGAGRTGAHRARRARARAQREMRVVALLLVLGNLAFFA